MAPLQKRWRAGLRAPERSISNYQQMKTKSYSANIEVALSQKDVFTRMNDFKKWWTTHLEGQSAKLNDEFVIRYGGDVEGDIHYSKHKLVEVIPNEKVVSV